MPWALSFFHHSTSFISPIAKHVGRCEWIKWLQNMSFENLELHSDLDIFPLLQTKVVLK
jgi:hypothetical protein